MQIDHGRTPTKSSRVARQPRRYSAAVLLAVVVMSSAVGLTADQFHGVAPNTASLAVQARGPVPVRGALGNDQALLSEARRVCLEFLLDMAANMTAMRFVVDPSSLQIQMAERSGDTTAVWAYVFDRSRHYAADCIAARTGVGPLLARGSTSVGSRGSTRNQSRRRNYVRSPAETPVRAATPNEWRGSRRPRSRAIATDTNDPGGQVGIR